MQSHRPPWSPSVKLAISLLLLALFIFLLFRFSLVLKPLIIAFILAFVLSPLVNQLQKRLHLGRGLAALLTYLVVLTLLTVIPILLIRPLSRQAAGLNLNIQSILTQVEFLLDTPVNIAEISIDPQKIFQQAIGSVQGLIEPIFSQTFTYAVEMISSMVWVIFILIVSFYLIKDAEVLQEWLQGLIPAVYRSDYLHIQTEINQIWSSFFSGQLLLALVVATIITCAGFIIGLPYALAMGALAGLLEFLPSVGHGIWLITASILALFGGSTWLPLPGWAFVLLIIALHIIFQQFDLNYLIPRIIGRSVHLPPLVVILGIVSGALLAGVLGILLAAPTIASARVIGRYIYANLFDMEPFPDSIAMPLPPPDPHWWRHLKTKEISAPSTEITHDTHKT